MLSCGRVFVLGAGFSKAAGMPLARELTDDFLEWLGRDGMDDGLAWFEGLRKRVGWEDKAKLTIEEVFQYAHVDSEWLRMQQHLCPVGRYDGDTPHVMSEAIDSWTGNFEYDLVEVLLERQRTADIEPIRRLARLLVPEDVAISFNYDCLLEKALDAERIKWSHGLCDYSLNKVTILKMHGSIDWFMLPRASSPSGGFTLLFEKENVNFASPDFPEEYLRLWRANQEDKVRLLVEDRDLNSNWVCGLAPLGPHKSLSQLVGSGAVWNRAAAALKTSQHIVFCGFSMSASDVMARSLFASVRTGTREKGLRPCKITIIDPNVHDLIPTYRSVFGDSLNIVAQCAEKVNWEEVAT